MSPELHTPSAQHLTPPRLCDTGGLKGGQHPDLPCCFNTFYTAQHCGLLELWDFEEGVCKVTLLQYIWLPKILVITQHVVVVASEKNE